MATGLQRRRLAHSAGRELVSHRVLLPLTAPVLKTDIFILYSSSSTPTVPYSTADILYGSEVNGSRGQQTDDVRQNSFSELEKSRDLARSRSKELEQNPNNKRPSSRSGKQKSLTIDSGNSFIIQ